MLALDIVLVAVMVTRTATGYQLTYAPLDYYKSMVECNLEKTRLQRKMESNVSYVCVKVDRD